MTNTAITVTLIAALSPVAGVFMPKPRHEFLTSIIINAPAQRVWTLLTETQKFPQWNPLVVQLEGNLAAGAALKVKIKLGNGAMDFKPTVIDYQEGREFTWLGSLGMRGIFDGAHRFAVEDLGDGRCRFSHEERFQGLLVPLFRKRLERDSLPLFQAMNLALKARAENSNVPAAHAE